MKALHSTFNSAHDISANLHADTPYFNRISLHPAKAGPGSPEDVQGRFSQADVRRVDGIEQELQNLRPLVVSIVI